jgi:rare lipoprotein A
LTSPDGLDLAEIPDAIPQQEFKSPSGNPDTYAIDGVTYRVMDTSAGYREVGLASWYGGYFHGRRTSSGDVYDMYRMTAAHKSLPLPTYVRVTHQGNGRSVVLRVNDRGPFVEDRIIDLSYAAAAKLGMADSGTAPVEVVALDPPARDRTR